MACRNRRCSISRMLQPARAGRSPWNSATRLLASRSVQPPASRCQTSVRAPAAAIVGVRISLLPPFCLPVGKGITVGTGASAERYGCARAACSPVSRPALSRPCDAAAPSWHSPSMTGRGRPGIISHAAQPLVDRAERATHVHPLPPPHPAIVAATDLGGVGVLKHGNLFLLSDPFGDIHPDSRGLGLYDLDTRVLSCAVLRINGVRPTLLRTQAAANHIATIQLTNPELRRDPAIKNEIGAAISSRAISITRRRWIAGG